MEAVDWLMLVLVLGVVGGLTASVAIGVQSGVEVPEFGVSLGVGLVSLVALGGVWYVSKERAMGRVMSGEYSFGEGMF